MPPKQATSAGLSEDLCPICKTQFLTKPKASAGYHNPDNANRMYQQVTCKRLMEVIHIEPNPELSSAPTTHIQMTGNVPVLFGEMILSHPSGLQLNYAMVQAAASAQQLGLFIRSVFADFANSVVLSLMIHLLGSTVPHLAIPGSPPFHCHQLPNLRNRNK
jgi:hypothetical protein